MSGDSRRLLRSTSGSIIDPIEKLKTWKIFAKDTLLSGCRIERVVTINICDPHRVPFLAQTIFVESIFSRVHGNMLFEQFNSELSWTSGTMSRVRWNFVRYDYRHITRNELS